MRKDTVRSLTTVGTLLGEKKGEAKEGMCACGSWIDKLVDINSSIEYTKRFRLIENYIDS